MTHPLEIPVAPLVRDFRKLQSRGDPFVLATILATEGSTYRKAGTQILVTADLEPRGLLSGGCLEVDLAEHARKVLDTGRPRVAAYDMRGEDDRVFGIGSGCEGAMRVLLQRVDADGGWQPLAALATQVESRAGGAIALVIAGSSAGRAWWPGGGDAPWAEPELVNRARESAAGPELLECHLGGESSGVLVIPLPAPPVLVLCGAGADARPLAQHAIALGFAVEVCDHRPALLDPSQFPHCALRCQPTEEFHRLPALAGCAAAIVMSHHLAADLAYLAALADSESIGYVGLLGPAPRRDRLLAMLGSRAAMLGRRLHAPVGLDIGARTPEAIALAIAAEIHSWLAQHD